MRCEIIYCKKFVVHDLKFYEYKQLRREPKTEKTQQLSSHHDVVLADLYHIHALLASSVRTTARYFIMLVKNLGTLTIRASQGPVNGELKYYKHS